MEIAHIKTLPNNDQLNCNSCTTISNDSTSMIHEHQYRSKRSLLKIIRDKNGSSSIPTEFADSEYIPSMADVTVHCAQNHTWKTIVDCVGQWCTICNILAQLRRHDTKIDCLQKQYSYGQNKFEFICSHKHHFIADLHSCKQGCRSCVTLGIARRKHDITNGLTLDILCLNRDQESRLRFHCNKFRHNPKCDNLECISIREKSIVSNREWAEDCKNFVPCNQDFYATPLQIKFEPNVLNCAKNHKWISRTEIYSVVRMMEILFDARFDDHTHEVDFTALNIGLKIAVTHLADKKSAKCVESAKKWCIKTCVKFVIIPAETVKTSRIMTTISNQLHKMGMFNETTPLSIVQRVRTKMHVMENNGKLFDDKCVY
jgi:hypothetical protein